jgi:hypothetical protein
MIVSMTHFCLEMGVDFKGQTVDARVLNLAAVSVNQFTVNIHPESVAAGIGSRVDAIFHLCRQGL